MVTYLVVVVGEDFPIEFARHGPRMIILVLFEVKLIESWLFIDLLVHLFP